MKKKILIVGGSKGIGRAIVKTLVPSNFVTNLSRTPPDFEHENLNNIPCDILKDNLPEINQIDTFIYCPGSINLKPINRLSIDDFKNDFEINVIGAVRCIQKYLNVLKKSDSASVLLFSTVAVKMGMPFHASVAAAKSAVEGLTKSLGAEFVNSIRFNVISPTITDTELASKLLRNEKMIENIKDRHPLKTFLVPQDVAEVASFLISDKASKISGQIFELDFGLVTFRI